jgi:hypothetical protein
MDEEKIINFAGIPAGIAWDIKQLSVSRRMTRQRLITDLFGCIIDSWFDFLANSKNKIDKDNLGEYVPKITWVKMGGQK